MNPPSALHGAMSRDRKPFTYTPGGLDLSEIKSSRMAARLMRNAMNEGIPELPKQHVQSPPMPSTPIAVPNFNCLPVQVFPTFNLPANPKSLLRTRSNPGQPRDLPMKAPPPQSSQFVNNSKAPTAPHYDTFNRNTPAYSQINNNRPVSMYEYNSSPSAFTPTNYGNVGYTNELPEISYDAEYFQVAPKNNYNQNIDHLTRDNEIENNTENGFKPSNYDLNPFNKTIENDNLTIRNLPLNDTSQDPEYSDNTFKPAIGTQEISIPPLDNNNFQENVTDVNNLHIDDKDDNIKFNEFLATENEVTKENKPEIDNKAPNGTISIKPGAINTESVVNIDTKPILNYSTFISENVDPKTIEDLTGPDKQKKEVKVVKKQIITKKENNVKEQNGSSEQNGDSEDQTLVTAPSQSSAARATKVEVTEKTLPDGSKEITKKTITTTKIDGKTEIKTKTETTIIPKEDDEEEVEEEEEEEEAAEGSVQEEIVGNSKENGQGNIVKTEERSETTTSTSKKVVVVQDAEEEEEEEEEVVEDEEIEEPEPVTFTIKKPAEKSEPPENEEEKQEDAKDVDNEEEIENKEEVEEKEVIVEKKEEVQESIPLEKEDQSTKEEEVEEEEEYEEAEQKEITKNEEKSHELETEPKNDEEQPENVTTTDSNEQVIDEKPTEEEKVSEESKTPEQHDNKEELKQESTDEKQEIIVEKQELKDEKKEVKEQILKVQQETSEQKVPLREPSVPLEKVEDVEIKPIGLGDFLTKTRTENTEIITNVTEKPTGLLTEINRIENIVTVNRTTKTLDRAYEDITQQGIPTVKTYFTPHIDRIMTSPLPSRPYQPVYPPEPTTERRHSLLLERLSVERQLPSDVNYQNNYQYTQTVEQQRQWSQEPQAEVLTVSNVKPSQITNQQWYQQRENAIYNNVTPSPQPTQTAAPSWTQPKAQPQPVYQPQPQYQPSSQPQYQAPQPQYHAPPQPQYQAPSTPQPQYQPSYTENVKENSSSTYQNTYSSYTPKPTNWATNTKPLSPIPTIITSSQPNQYSYSNKESSESYQKTSQNFSSSSYIPPPWEQDSTYVAPEAPQNFYQPPPQTSSFSPAPNKGWTPNLPTSKFSKPPPKAYIPPKPNQSFVVPVSNAEPPKQPGRKTYYSEYERRYISVPESTYIPGESKFQAQPDPSPAYYYDNNEPAETVEPQWRRELREFTEKSQTQTRTEINVKPPWESETKYAKASEPTYTPTPTWSQTVRPQSWRERSFESEFVSQEWPKTNTLGRGRPLSSYAKDTIPERTRGVSVDRYNPNSYQSPVVAEHPPVPTHTHVPPAPHATGYHNPNVPAYHARASAEPREQVSYQQPRNLREARASPFQSRSFKYLQWITGTED